MIKFKEYCVIFGLFVIPTVGLAWLIPFLVMTFVPAGILQVLVFFIATALVGYLLVKSLDYFGNYYFSAKRTEKKQTKLEIKKTQLHEIYIIAKYTQFSYKDILRMSNFERNCFAKFIADDLEAELALKKEISKRTLNE